MTLKDLEKLKQEGKIRGYTDSKGAAFHRPLSKSKYGNRKVELDGFVFDSVKESRRYMELRMLKNAGEINSLQLQVEFELNEGGSHSVIYRADFVYYRAGELIVEDVKGFRTREYKKKKRLMMEVHGIEIKEV